MYEIKWYKLAAFADSEKISSTRSCSPIGTLRVPLITLLNVPGITLPVSGIVTETGSAVNVLLGVGELYN